MFNNWNLNWRNKLHAILRFPARSFVARSAGVFFKAHDRKFAAILTCEKWVGKNNLPLSLPRYFSFEPNSHSLGRIFVSPQASSEFESKMALAWSIARGLAKIRLHCRLDYLWSTSEIICGLGSFAVQFGDHFRSGDHLLRCTVSLWIFYSLT